MQYPAFVIENKFRRLYEVAFLIPPGANRITLFYGNAVGNGEGQFAPDFLGFILVVVACRHHRRTQFIEGVDTFSVAV